MRSTIVFILLCAMLASSAVLLLVRERTGGTASTRPGSPDSARPDAGASSGADARTGQPDHSTPGQKSVSGSPSSGSPGQTSAGQGGEASGDKPAAGPNVGRKPVLPAGPGRAIRVVAMGWDLLVPGIIANDGVESNDDSLFGKRGVACQLASVARARDIEAALARGGGDEAGADIAIVPLPVMVAFFENLRALDPEVFFVVGWSRGRDALVAGSASTLVGLARKREVTLAGTPDSTATLLGLFALDLAGIPPEKVKLLDPGDVASRKADVSAIDRAAEAQGGAAPSTARVLVTTADATDLIPYVAIAPRGFLDSYPDAIQAWMAVWLDGADKMRSDVPGAARQVAAISGAPQPIELLRRLGQLEPAPLGENARLAGLSGRGAVTIESLFSITWRLLRGIGVLSTPAPGRLPLATAAISQLVVTASSRPADRDDSKPSFTAQPILRLTIDLTSGDDAGVSALGLAAGIFARSALRVGVAGNKKRSDALISQTVERFGLASARLAGAYRLGTAKTAVVEILAAP